MRKKEIRQLAPPAVIGIIGGGQLGRMITLEAKRMGYHVIVLDPKPHSPAGQVSDEQMIAEYDDFESLLNLANKTHVITYEFEHIDVTALKRLEAYGYPIYPSSHTLQIIQDKFIQKSFLKKIGVPVPEFKRTEDLNQLRETSDAWNEKVVLKTCKEGYDGKGSFVINRFEMTESAFEPLKNKALMMEQFIPFEKEVSLIIARNHKGIECFPIAENIHQDGILIKTKVPANVSTSLSCEIREVGMRIVEALDDYGIFCIEFFIDQNGHLLVNEVAPRPHNSGHYSIEGCVTSQYEQLVRILTGMPLGSTRLRQPCVMFNILGHEYVNGSYTLEGVETVMAIEDCHLHVYGKQDTQHLKKIGHVTACSELIEDAEAKAYKAINGLIIKQGGVE